MNSFCQEASEAEEIVFEGKQTEHCRKTRLTNKEVTTPGTTFTSPWMDTNISPDTCFINTVAHMTLLTMDANKQSDSSFISAFAQTMSPVDKVDSWFASTSAGPSQCSKSRPNTRETVLSSVAGDQSQLSNQKAGDASLDSCAARISKQAPLPDAFLNSVHQPQIIQMDGSSEVPGLVADNESEPSTPNLGTRDPFFDTVPKGPSQLSISRWDARAPAFDPLDTTRGQPSTSSWNKTKTPCGPGKNPSIH